MSVSTAATSIPSTAQVRALNILHTSDWHLGRRLYGRLRYDEFAAFLYWLHDTIHSQRVDVLIVAGDIFDTMTPSNKAQALYYEFLGKVSKSCCQHVVIVAGNHDSPTFLDAPSQVLKFLNVHVIGTACDDLSDEVLVLEDADNNPHCIIAAVPYLRDRDVRSSQAGESGHTKDANVIAGIEAHYRAVTDRALAEQATLLITNKQHVPIVATGHLFAAGGRTTEDDGVRDLYVGSLGSVSANIFDSAIDYVALGHLHVPQKVGGYEHIRYCGSPIAMGFGEARQQKQVLLIAFGTPTSSNTFSNNKDQLGDIINLTARKKAVSPSKKQNLATAAQYTTLDLFDDLAEIAPADPLDSAEQIETTKAIIDTQQECQEDKKSADQVFYDTDKSMQIAILPVPSFQKLAQISGDWEQINTALTILMQSAPSVWLEVIYTGRDMMTDLRDRINGLITDSNIEVLKIRNMQIKDKVMLQAAYSQETLQDLSHAEVFERCLSAHDIVDAQKPALREAYHEIVQMIGQDDANAE